MPSVVKLKTEPVVTYDVRQIPIERIRAFDFQPRKWFDPVETHARAESMKALGQQDPVTVEPVYGDAAHDYELINGESRLRSAREAGLDTLWAAVRSIPFESRTDKHLASLVANFNRSDHAPMEVSDALHIQVTEGGKSQTDIGRVLGKPQTWVSKYLSLQRLHPDIQKLLHPSVSKRERLAANTGFELARLPHDRQLEIFRKARGSGGKVIMRRVQLRALQSLGKIPLAAHIDAPPRITAWTPEREERYRQFHRPTPDVVTHLRAGISKFRRLLEERYNFRGVNK